MCAIAGLVGRAEDGPAVVRMLDLMSHRGPDGKGLWAAPVAGRSVHLGHRRLSIIDLSDAGAQPMADASCQFVITYNGELYNYLELQAELTRLGVEFRSSSDTEVLLEAYKRWGPACLDRFNGMFAFAILDMREATLFCARDRYGEKPFLFSFSRDFFAFSSEYKALLSVPGVRREYDELKLLRAANDPSTGLDSERETVFPAIEQLLPGEAMTVDLRSLGRRTWRYWELQPKGYRDNPPEGQVCEEFRALLLDSVRLRMRGDVPVGSCLSGGLDSGTIVSLVRKDLNPSGEYHTFTGCFPGTWADEWAQAQRVVDCTGVTSHVVEPTVDGFIEELPEFVWHNELPVGSSSQYAQYCVFRLAKKNGITVLLDGQGADELLGGYEQFFVEYVASLRELGEHDRLSRELPLILERYPLALTPTWRRLRDHLPFGVRHWLSNRSGKGSNLRFGLRLDAAKQIGETNQRHRLDGFSALNGALKQESFGRYLTTLLRYGDRNSMAHSREVRLPFCDHRLAEFVLSLPPHLLMGNAQTKRLLRDAAKGLLPEAVRTSWNKRGFRPPQDQWFRSKRFLDLVRATLTSARFRNSEYWLPSWWEKALKRVEQGETQLGWTLWHPFFAEVWKDHFVARLSEGAPPRRTTMAT